MLNKPSPAGRVTLLLSAEALHRQPDRYVVTGHWILTNGPGSIRMASEVAQLGHRKIDKDTFDAEKCVDGCITSLLLPREVSLSNFHREGTGGKEGSSAAGVAIGECLAAKVEPSLIRIVNVGVVHEEANPVRVRGLSVSRCVKPLAKFLQSAIALVVKVQNSAATIQLLNLHEVITSPESFLMLNQGTGAQDIFS